MEILEHCCLHIEYIQYNTQTLRKRIRFGTGRYPRRLPDPAKTKISESPALVCPPLWGDW
jgi:hypothetical protein